MQIITLNSSNKVLGQDPIHPHIGRQFRTTDNRTAFGCVIEDVIAVVSCVAFTKDIATTMNKIAVESDSPDTAMFWTVYKTKEASQITELPTAVGAKALLQMVKHVKATMPHIVNYATLSPIPTLSTKFTDNMEDTAVTDWLSQRKDPVARFHLRNGAKLHQLNKNADNSNLRMKQSYGAMVNYLYHV